MGTKPKINDYQDLIVWQRSIDLIEKIYKLTSKFPESELYGLSSQIKRAAVSIASNIAEGKQRSTRKDFSQFLRISLGSCAEVETQIFISKKLSFISNLEYNECKLLLDEIRKMLKVFILKLGQAPLTSKLSTRN